MVAKLGVLGTLQIGRTQAGYQTSLTRMLRDPTIPYARSG
jgi:hypothetical protein